MTWEQYKKMHRVHVYIFLFRWLPHIPSAALRQLLLHGDLTLGGTTRTLSWHGAPRPLPRKTPPLAVNCTACSPCVSVTLMLTRMARSTPLSSMACARISTSRLKDSKTKMKSSLLLSVLSTVSGSDLPGAFSSLSATALDRAAKQVANTLVTDLRGIKIPAHKDPILRIDELKFEDFTVGSVGVTVKDGEGLEFSLMDISNTIAHSHFCAGLPAKCCGEIWASSTGQSFTGMNQIVVDDTTGLGKIVTTVPKGDLFRGRWPVGLVRARVTCIVIQRGVVPIAATAARSPSRSFLYSLVFARQRRGRPAVMEMLTSS